MLPLFQRLPQALASRVEKHPLLCILIVIGYVLVPMDVLPEAFLGPLGAFDDALVAIAAVALLKSAAKSRVAARATAPKTPPPDPERPADSRPSDGPRGQPRDDGRDQRRDDRRPDNRRHDRRRR